MGGLRAWLGCLTGPREVLGRGSETFLGATQPANLVLQRFQIRGDHPSGFDPFHPQLAAELVDDLRTQARNLVPQGPDLLGQHSLDLTTQRDLEPEVRLAPGRDLTGQLHLTEASQHNLLRRVGLAGGPQLRLLQFGDLQLGVPKLRGMLLCLTQLRGMLLGAPRAEEDRCGDEDGPGSEQDPDRGLLGRGGERHQIDRQRTKGDGRRQPGDTPEAVAGSRGFASRHVGESIETICAKSPPARPRRNLTGTTGTAG